MIPPGALRANIEGRTVGPYVLAHVALVVLDLHQRNGRVTIRDVADETGYAISTTHRALRGLREHGIVDFEPRMTGTLHPTVRLVA